MSIRSAAKAIIVHNGQVLLNRCSDIDNGEYYALPGGGQHPYETLHAAIIRECKEETGYQVEPLRCVGICEAISLDEEYREKYPDYAHKMYHIFLCALSNAEQETPTEIDNMQVGSEWIDMEKLSDIRLLPSIVGENIMGMLNGTTPMFLGSEFVRFNHG